MGLNLWIRRRYGRKKAMLRCWRHWWLWQLGGLRDLSQVDWSRVERLVFVCHGNICRSPYGELIAREYGWPTISCGLFAKPGESAHPMALQTAAQRGRTLDVHRSQSFDQIQWLPGDLVLCYEVGHARECRQMLKERLGSEAESIQVGLVGLLGALGRPHIEDPFGLTLDYFHSCYEWMETYIPKVKKP